MKRVKIALAVLALALVGVTAWRVTQPPDEPVYRGKPLTTWLMWAFQDSMTLTEQAGGREADEALSRIGTNAIPTLLKFLRMKDSALKVRLMDLALRQHIINFDYTSDTGWNLVAVHGFSILGTNAQAAVPALIGIANQNISPYSKSGAITALGYVGPSAKEAVPSLLRWATNADLEVRFSATNALRNIDPEAAAKAGIANRVLNAGHSPGNPIPRPPSPSQSSAASRPKTRLP
jgi:hypothetical protein